MKKGNGDKTFPRLILKELFKKFGKNFTLSP